MLLFSHELLARGFIRMATHSAANSGGGFLLATPYAPSVYTPEQLDPEQRLIRATAAGFIRDEVLPRADALENEPYEPSVHLLRQAGELGLLAADVPAAYGGLGL